MAVVVRSVPASVERNAVQSFLESLGIDLGDVLKESAVVISWDALRCEVVARDADGEIMADGGDIATHHVTIPIVDA